MTLNQNDKNNIRKNTTQIIPSFKQKILRQSCLHFLNQNAFYTLANVFLKKPKSLIMLCKVTPNETYNDPDQQG